MRIRPATPITWSNLRWAYNEVARASRLGFWLACDDLRAAVRQETAERTRR